VTGDLSDDCRSFLTILDNVLTVGVWPRGEERSRRPQSQSAGLTEGAGVGTKMAHRRTSPRRSGDSESAGKNNGHRRVLR
jgi:hypothetical protein